MGSNHGSTGALPFGHTNQMIGTHPTVGCIAFIEKALSGDAVKLFQQALHPIIPEDSWRCPNDVWVSASAMLADSHHSALLYSQVTKSTRFIFLDFDEDEIVNHSRRTGLSIEELLLPCVRLMWTIRETLMIGLGFEVSPPEGLEDQVLRDNGIAVIYLRNHSDDTWVRKQLLPIVGHYL